MFDYLFVLILGIVAGRLLAQVGRRTPQSRLICPLCNQPRQLADRCLACGWTGASDEKEARHQALHALSRQVVQLSQRYFLPREASQRLLAAIQQEREHMGHDTAAQAHPGPQAASPIPLSAGPLSSLAAPIPGRLAAPSHPPTEAPPPVPLPPAERVRRYAESKRNYRDETAAATGPSVAIPTAAPLHKLLSAFLEERNIRWGEIIAGLLIICCSIALVVSFWTAIAERPVLKFILFNGVTASLFALAGYMHKRWKLPTTSRGILVIASLLVPLNFLAIAAMAQGAAATSPLLIAGELLSLALFGSLLWLAGSQLAGQLGAALVAGIMIPSAVQLLTTRVITVDSPALQVFGLVGAVIAAHAWGVISWSRQHRGRCLTEEAAHHGMRLLGITGFAALVTVALVLYRWGSPAWAASRLAPMLMLLCFPALLLGLRLWRDAKSELAGLKLPGSLITMLAALGNVYCVLLAWPHAAILLPCALLNVAILAGLARTTRLAALHYGAGGFLMLAALLAYHLGHGSVPWIGDGFELLPPLISLRSGWAMLWITLGFVAISAAMAHWKNLAAGGSAPASDDGLQVIDHARPYAHVAMAAGGICLATGLYITFSQPLVMAAEYCWPLSLVALALTLRFLSRSLWISFQWVLAAAVVLQVAATLSKTDWFVASARPWLEMPMLQAQGIAVGLFCLFGMTSRMLVRRLAAQQATENARAFPQRMFDLVLGSARWHADRTLAMVVVGLLLVAAVYAAVPGAAQELSPRSLAHYLEGQPWSPGATARVVPSTGHFEFLGISPVPARQWPTWLLVAVAASCGLLALRERISTGKIAVLVLIASCVAPLAASRWVDEIAVASALRWWTAGLLFVISLAIWNRRVVGRWLGKLGWSWNEQALYAPQVATTTAFAMALLPLAAMVIFVGLAAVQFVPANAHLEHAFIQSGIVAGIAAMASAAMLMTSQWLERQSALSSSGTAAGGWMRTLGLLILILGTAPVVVVAVTIVSQALRANPIVGPDSASFFAQLGLAGSYVIPTLLIAFTLVGYALRERSPRFAFSAGLSMNLCATAGYLLTVRGGGPQAEVWLNVAHLNAVVPAVYSLGWTAASFGLGRVSTDEPRRPAALHLTYTTLPSAVVVAVLLPHLARLFSAPAHVASWPMPSTSLLAWTAAALACAASALLWLRSRQSAAFHLTVLGCAELALLAALTTRQLDHGNWLTFHVVQLVWVGLAWLVASHMTWGRFRLGRWQHTLNARETELAHADESWRVALAHGHFQVAVARVATLALISVATFWSLRSWMGDPAPAWTVVAVAALAPLAALIASQTRRHRYLYLGGLLINLAVSLAWINHSASRGVDFNDSILRFLAVNSIALCAPAPIWVAIAARESRRFSGGAIPLYSLAAWSGLVFSAWLVFVGLTADSLQARSPVDLRFAWVTLFAAVWAMASCLKDAADRSGGPGLYLLGICGLGMLLDSLDVAPQRLGWLALIFAGCYTLATSYLGSRRDLWMGSLHRWKLVAETKDEPAGAPAWLIALTRLLATMVVAAAVAVSLTFADFSQRVIAAQTGMVQAVALGLLAREKRRSGLQQHALGLFAAGAVALAWAVQGSAAETNGVQRGLAVMISLSLVGSWFGLGLGKLLPALREWTPAAQRLLPGVLTLAAAALFVVLGAEFLAFVEETSFPLGAAGIATVAVVLCGLSAAAIVAAVVPGRDPFNWPDERRTLYVYAAEALLALLFLHVRMAMPWLFRGFFTQYWPLIAMALAFAGLGLAELFRRQQRMVLAEPLERTGALLPLLTVMAFWVFPSQADFPLVLLAAGGLYAASSVMRRSFAYGIAATVAANAALWFWLHRSESWGIAQHPQLWLIPPALCLLAAAYINRRQLSAAEFAAVRYAAALAIYVSSTADIFLNGVGEAPWLPGVLAGLSVLGILAGIALRVRGFLYLGTSFLLLALGTVIWYAAVDLQQTWLWYASGIALGVAILVVFAIFEKKRLEVLHLVDHLRKWQP